MFQIPNTRFPVTSPQNTGKLPTCYGLATGKLYLQRVSIACYAERCISHSKSVRLSVCLSVCPSVRHTLALSQNDSSYDHGVFTGG